MSNSRQVELARSHSPALTCRPGAIQAPSSALPWRSRHWTSFLATPVDSDGLCICPGIHSCPSTTKLSLCNFPCFCILVCATLGVGSGGKDLQYHDLQTLALVREGSRVRFKRGRPETLTWELLSIKTPWPWVSKVKLRSPIHPSLPNPLFLIVLALTFGKGFWKACIARSRGAAVVQL